MGDDCAQFVRTSYVLYLAQGWAGVFLLQPMLAALSTTAVGAQKSFVNRAALEAEWNARSLHPR